MSGVAAAETETKPEKNADAAAGESDAREQASSRPAPPVPLGVRFANPLENQRFRVAYRFERMERRGLLNGDRHLSPRNVIDDPRNQYDRAPRTLEVTVHTVQLAYAPHPRATLIIEVPFLLKELETVHDSDPRTKDSSQGVGDVGFTLLVPFIRKGNESSSFYIGFDIPTGSIRRGGDEMRLPFDLQIGNGTFDFEWGWTYRGEMDWLSWGGQVSGRHPLGKNDLKYRVGSRFDASAWGAVRLLAGWSASLRLGWQKQNNIRMQGRDLTVDPILDPSDNPKKRGGTLIIVSPGLTFELPRFGNQRLAVEFGIPVHQDLDGPQLKQDWSVKAGWQWAF